MTKTDTRTYANQFPNFDPATLPQIPPEWDDMSWGNDVCPSWQTGDLAFRVFVDYPVPAEREFPDTPRYSVSRYASRDPQSELEPLFHSFATEDWQHVLAFVAARPQIDAMAFEFASVLRKELNRTSWSEMRRRNSASIKRGKMSTCASHDFIDANEIMAAAFSEIFGRDMDPGSELDAALATAAWDIAKTYYLSELPKLVTMATRHYDRLVERAPDGNVNALDVPELIEASIDIDFNVRVRPHHHNGQLFLDFIFTDGSVSTCGTQAS